MRKLTFFLCMVLCSIALHANVATGTCGDSLTWSYDTETQALTIEGTGDMYDYDPNSWSGDMTPPWYQISSEILSISLPDGLTGIGSSAFSGCSALTEVLWNPIGKNMNVIVPDTINPNAVYFVNTVGWSDIHVHVWGGTKDATVWPGIEASKANFTINGSDVYYFTATPGDYAYCIFNNGGAGSQTDNLTWTGGYFYFDNKWHTSEPFYVANIGANAFRGCSSLSSFTIPDIVINIADGVLCGCSSLTSINIPNKVTSIGGYAFYGCSALTSITIPDSVTSIGNNAFGYCSALTSITWNAKNCNNFSGGSPFSNSNNITSFVIGEEVESIPSDLCYGISSLTSVTIPNSVTNIGSYAFNSCSRVIVECTTPPTIAESTFKSGAAFLVPCAALENYLQTAIWQFLDLKGINHNVNLSATEGGKATLTATDCSANTVTIEAAADNYYRFSQWSDGNTDNPRTLTLTQDTTLQAIFGPTPSYSVILRGNSIGGSYKYLNDKGNIVTQWFDSDSEISITVREGLSVYFYENNMSCGTWLGWSDGVTDNNRCILKILVVSLQSIYI
ncbi:MAG: leucine-rich repeat protein, partial [Paludibacteraceae bacterium]